MSNVTRFSCALVALGLLVDTPAFAAPSHQEAAPPPSADEQLAIAAVCENVAKAPTPSNSAARFSLARSGALTVADDSKSKALSFMFSDALAGSVARFDVINDDGKTTRGAACGVIEANRSYEIDASDTEGRVVAVQLFENGAGVKSEMTSEAQSVRTAAAAVERLELHREREVADLAFAARTALTDPTPQNLSAVDAAATAELSTLSDLRRKLLCAAPRPDGEFGADRCDEALTIAKNVAVLRAAFSHAAASPYEARALVLQSDKIGDSIAALDAGPELTSDARVAQCRRLRTLRWLSEPWAKRPVARAFVPVIPARQRLFVARYGENVSDDGVKTGNVMGLVVTGVPRGQKTSFAVHNGKAVSSDLASLLVTFVPLLRKLAPGMLFAGSRGGSCADELGDELCKRIEERRAALRIKSAVCLPAEDPSEDQALTVDEALLPSALVESRATIFGPLPRTNILDVVACQGETCTGGDDDKAAKSRLTITPDRSGTFTLLVELSFGFPILDKDGWAHGLRSGNAPTFQAVGGPDGPDQLYEVRQPIDPRSAVTTSALLGYRVCDRWLIGFGPALLIGTSGGTFTQWNLRGGWSFAKGLVLTFGPSLRLLPYLNDFEVGERASVARSATGGSTAPSGNSHYAGELQLDVGLGIDLASITGAAADTIKSFGGGK